MFKYVCCLRRVHAWGQSNIHLLFFPPIFFPQFKVYVLITSWQWWLKMHIIFVSVLWPSLKVPSTCLKILWQSCSSGARSGSSVGCCGTGRFSRDETETSWRRWSTGRQTESWWCNIAVTSNMWRTCGQMHQPFCILCCVENTCSHWTESCRHWYYFSAP